MKFIITENKREKAVIHWLDRYFGDVKPYRSDNYLDYIFFIKDGEVVFEFWVFTRGVDVNYDTLWQPIELLFGLNYFEIQRIVTRWVNDRFNLDVLMSHEKVFGGRWTKIENEIKNNKK